METRLIICGVCGTGNSNDSYYCTECGVYIHDSKYEPEPQHDITSGVRVEGFILAKVPAYSETYLTLRPHQKKEFERFAKANKVEYTYMYDEI